MLMCLLFTPAFASAATAKPTCALTVYSGGTTMKIKKGKEDVFVQKGSEIKIAWESKNAKTAESYADDDIQLSGTETDTPDETQTYSYTFSAGSRDVTCSVRAVVVSGEINKSSLTVKSGKPTITGTAEGAKKVQVILRKHGETKNYFISKETTVKKGGKWSVKVAKKIPDGVYDVLVSAGKGSAANAVASGTLSVGAAPKADTTFTVATVPLLGGGIARAGTSVPVAYLQVKNTGLESAQLRGFWIKQSGTAPVSSIIGLTTIDDKSVQRGSVGGTEGFAIFKDGQAFAPADATFLPGERKLFTVRTIVSKQAAVGKSLIIDVTGTDASATIKGAFPIKGTLYTIGY